MSEFDNGLNSVNGTMSIALNGTKMICQGSVYMATVMVKLIMICKAKREADQEISGCVRKVMAMVKSGGISCCTMSIEASKLLEKYAKKYGFQYSVISNGKDKFETVYIRKSDVGQFNQFCKEHGVGVTYHGDLTSVPEKPLSRNDVDEILNNPKFI